MRRLLPILILLASAGCQTTVGNYFANRGRDLGECFHAQFGFGGGLGVGARAGGVVDLGMMVAHSSRQDGVGWDYGDGFAFGAGETGDMEEWEVNVTVLQPLTLVALPFLPLGGFEFHGGGNPAWLFLLPTHWKKMKSEARGWQHRQINWAVLPGLLAGSEEWTKTYEHSDRLWIGTDQLTETIRKARVHSCDVELGVFAGFIHARAGFSPGEFLDFFLGWFGIDIACDDEGTTGGG